MTCHKLLLLGLFLANCGEPGAGAEESRTTSATKDSRNVADEAFELARSLLLEYDNYNVTKGIQLARTGERRKTWSRGSREERESLVEDLLGFANNHIIKVQLYDLYENIVSKIKEEEADLNVSERSFGFQKLMVPVMIGVQIVKSVLFAMFLPSILGNLGRVVGEGVKYLSSQGQFPSGLGNNLGQIEDFDLKDVNGYDQPYQDPTQPEASSAVHSFAYPNTIGYNKAQSGGGSYAQSSVASRFTTGAHKLNYIPNNNHFGSFYTKHHGKRQNFKVFHNIPSSSLLLTNYDPFYSPLLSRMDSMFKQLGYETESCREKLICLMYKNPAKFAPYSNLISAQLSRELNELRKPSTDNPDILRFFKYMKAAKDGQDGVECSKEYASCEDNRESISSPMVKTYNEINKLVHARKMSK